MIGFVMCGKPRFSGEWVRLGDICNVRSGGTPKRSVSEYWDKGTIPWVKIGDISSKYISAIEENISEAGLKNSAAKLFQPGTLLFSIFASIGAVGILTVPAATNQAIAGLEIKSNIINRDYLYYFLKASEMGAKRSGRGVAQNNINLSILRDMKVPVPSLAEQSAIAREFERIDCQIDNANNQLSSLDALVKSRFIEMFGDPVYGKRWPSVTLAELCTKLGSGATPLGGKSAYKTEGVPFVRSMNVRNGRCEWKDLAYIDDDQALKLKNVTLEKGDVLLNITGASVARSCLLPDELAGGRVNQHVSIVRINQDKMLPIVLNAVLISDSYQSFLLSGSKTAGSTREALTKGDLEKMTAPLPPVDLQRQFAAFVRKVDKLRFMLLGTLRLYIAAVHFVAQQKVAMAGLF